MTDLCIADYALIANCHTAALVGSDGSIDWLCLPRLDGPACFANLLGTPENGRWRIGPRDGSRATQRRYRPGTMILETLFETPGGTVRVTDLIAFPVEADQVDLVRRVEGVSGLVAMQMEAVLRFNYGQIKPWATRQPDGMRYIAGFERLQLRAPMPLESRDFKTLGAFDVAAGERHDFTLTWSKSHLPAAGTRDVGALVETCAQIWTGWASRIPAHIHRRSAVERSLLTLKSLAYQPTGGIAAAATTSLPERLGGSLNWDYRFCWVRDASFTVAALLGGGFTDEAEAWRDWLLRAAAGDPAELRVMYGVAGEPHLPESELGWLAGYRGSRPVRIGNAASSQFQLDIYGELISTLHVLRRSGIELGDDSWDLQRGLANCVEARWRRPDSGFWESRGRPRHHVHSKAMAWVALDRSIKAAEEHDLEAPLDRWRATRAAIHRDVCARGFDRRRNSFVQHYGSRALDASVLLLPLTGFLPADDPRIVGTVAAITDELMTADGLMFRYSPQRRGRPEGSFVACGFWMVSVLALMGRRAIAERLFARQLKLANDVGLLAEEFDTVRREMIGNTPQALSHLALVHAAQTLTDPDRTAVLRG